jgi:hypothetical protein
MDMVGGFGDWRLEKGGAVVALDGGATVRLCAQAWTQPGG